ncbi:undecaprenyl-phosphate 4-deoxy-4-formamido-L-arabinose transferase [Fibrobacter sp. UWT3]|uniref:glycosyltransferase family 2 protein n=1 Tax=Fibrobacter sp. UWT3 TaxID=1896225 RepID=UPI000BCF298C|nr:glycosyltransferase family 2 protein [Fibrobacter sp. UWT3]SOE45506.1 undecaprenyl-phosphate 4-deoxy-4-formamido-L-arabinose transferase [Fibrobacter sp. UWT3]
MNRKLSFVIPCYRSENTVMTVVDEIENTVSQRPEYDYEIILVNDGSPDNVWDVISERVKTDDNVVGINLSKNFGQHSALMAGYNNVGGDIVVSLDDDGQTPACDVFKLIDELDRGYDIVYAQYPETRQSWFRRLGSDFTKKVTDYLFDIKGEKRKGSSYFVAKRYLIDEMVKYKNAYPFLSGLVLRSTRNIGVVDIEHRNRIEGQSGYSINKLLALWLNGFTAFSIKPLKLGTYCGFFLAALGFVYAMVTVIRKLFITPMMEAGWSSIISIMLVIGGMVLIMLGLMGEYIGRIYICINNSPQYVVKEFARKGRCPKVS